MGSMKCLKQKLSWMYLFTFSALLALDLITKAYIAKSMRLGQSIPVIKNFFHITLVHNKGVAFGMGNQLSKYFFIVASVIAIFVLIYVFCRLKPHENLSKLGTMLILSGAIGNLVDRIRLGYVIDFLHFFIDKHHWPSFNVADSAISVGAALFVLEILRANKREAAA